MTLDEFWQTQGYAWPICEAPHCELPAIVGVDNEVYACWEHGLGLLITGEHGKAKTVPYEAVPWITIGETKDE
jgi:hypothetical protein